VGDLVRLADEEVRDPIKRQALAEYLQKNYRGFYSVEQLLQSQDERDVGKALLPTEYILALLKREITRVGRKAIFIDGLPRTLDQISYSLFFRELIGFRDDPDFFVLIQIPETVIDERLKYRRVCPKCQTPRNLKLLITQKFGWDNDKQEFYLQCDNPACQGARMVTKEGDDRGIEPIKTRLKTDGELIDQAFSLYGIPKILLRNSVPVKEKDKVDEYELTPEYLLKQNNGILRVETKPWIVKDDLRIDSYSLLAPAVVVAMIKQMVEILGL
jgi:adenylate kinase family enzyme